MNKLKAMREGGAILGRVREQLFHFTQVGVTPFEIEEEAVRLIKKEGGELSFTRVPGYKYATCINLDAGIVHGLPTSREPLVSGTVVTVDVGVYYHGYHTDCAFTKVVGQSTKEKDRFLEVGLKSIELALAQVKPGARVGNISQATENVLRQAGYSPTQELTGHGVGRELHEEPMIPNIAPRDINSTPELVLHQTLAIENIYCLGKGELVMEDDGWTISTKDGKISAVFEETVEVTKDGFSVLTKPTLLQIFQSGKIR